MTGRLLDVSTMPFERVYACKDGSEIDLTKLVDSHYNAIRALAYAGLIKANNSFGFAMLEPVWQVDGLDDEIWDNPEQFVWFVGGWGSDRDRYIANAVRKLRPMLRPATATGGDFVMSTLDIRFNLPEHFQDKVDQQNDDGTFPWGDFPWGGAVVELMGDLALIGAVSCLSEIEDDFIAKLILGGIGKRIIEGDKLLSDD